MPAGSEFLSVENCFPEMAECLFWWVANLSDRLKKDGVEQVFFLSREGQPLKVLFDRYQRAHGRYVQSKYLEVSRRSTLLPSLNSLQNESFETLFRQYRQISLWEFLSSLGLESHAAELIEELGLPDSALRSRQPDFPNSNVLAKLRLSLRFIAIYEEERSARRAAFVDYLTELSGGILPNTLAVVDVGWKGTIQDHLHALLCKHEQSEVKSLSGYYIGLVGAGSAGPNNTKAGLLFSSTCGQSPYFHIFNENRALFEVILAADHGSVVSYIRGENGRGRAVRGEFDEQEMLANFVFPIQKELFARFEMLLNTRFPQSGAALALKSVAKSHARMVFNPTMNELRWFSSVYHVENYGVIEKSFFADVAKLPTVLERTLFLFNLIIRRQHALLGFWPWKTIRERAGRMPASLYAFLRIAKR